MKQIEVKVYLRHKRKPFITAIFHSDEAVEQFFDDLKHEEKIVRLETVVFAVKEFRYATIKYLN